MPHWPYTPLNPDHRTLFTIKMIAHSQLCTAA